MDSGDLGRGGGADEPQRHQRRLTEQIGTVGATQVRFLYGFPFALLALAVVTSSRARASLPPTWHFLLYALGGPSTQIIATALMLSAMRERAFSVVTAYTKTEPVQVALFGLLLLGDPLTPAMALAILVATCSVLLMSVKPGTSLASSGLRPVLFGLASGAFFALAAIGFRGAILSLGEAPPIRHLLRRGPQRLPWLAAGHADLRPPAPGLAPLGLFDRHGGALMASFDA